MDFSARQQWYMDGEHWDPQVPFENLHAYLLQEVDFISNMEAHPDYALFLEFYTQEMVPKCIQHGDPHRLYLDRDILWQMLGDDSHADNVIRGIQRRESNPPIIHFGKKTYFEVRFALAILMDRYVDNVDTTSEKGKTSMPSDPKDDEWVSHTDFVRWKQLAAEMPVYRSWGHKLVGLDGLPVIIVNDQEYLLLDDILWAYHVIADLRHKTKTEVLSELEDYYQDDFLDFAPIAHPPQVQNLLRFQQEDLEPISTLLGLRHLMLQDAPSQPSDAEFAAMEPHVPNI